MPEPVIVAAARSPIGRAHKGSLISMRPDDLAAALVRSALDSVPRLDPAEVTDLLLGVGLPGGEAGFNLARVVSVLLGRDDLPGTTVNRYCASSLQTTAMAAHAIRAGAGDAFIAAGVETVSRIAHGTSDVPGAENPLFDAARERTDERAAGAVDGWSDPREVGALPDVYLAMWQTAENVARLRGIGRAEQDEFAVRSHQLAERAIDSGFRAREITPVTCPDGTVVDADDCPRRGLTIDAVTQLPPAFRPDGTVTAANCCPYNDGAAALVVMSDTRAKELGIAPLARIVSTAVSALSPEIMGLGPVQASRNALAQAGMNTGDIDLVELNEVFAAQAIPCIDDLGLDIDRVNVHGGAIAIGHPFGMTGARMITTLLHGLQWRDEQTGLVTTSAAGGQGMAIVLERLS